MLFSLEHLCNTKLVEWSRPVVIKMRDKGPMVDFCFYIISSLVSKLTLEFRGIWLRGTDFVILSQGASRKRSWKRWFVFINTYRFRYTNHIVCCNLNQYFEYNHLGDMVSQVFLKAFKNIFLNIVVIAIAKDGEMIALQFHTFGTD